MPPVRGKEREQKEFEFDPNGDVTLIFFAKKSAAAEADDETAKENAAAAAKTPDGRVSPYV